MAAVTQALRDLLGDGAADAVPLTAAELHARWAHRIELDETRAHYDASGRLRLVGALRFEGEASLRLQAADQALLRIGARVLDAQGAPIPGIEARAGLPQGEIAPGQALPFSLTLPRFDASAGDAAIEVGLVYEGRFWFSEHGFQDLRLTLADTDEQDGSVPSAAPVEQHLAAPPPEPPKSAAAAAVELLYRALLGREADPEGLAHYETLLELGELDEKGVADALIGSAEFRDRPGPSPLLASWTIVRLRGCQLLVPDNDLIALDREPAALRHFLDACALGASLIDVGAGVGAYALPAALRVGETGVVHALEADPARARLLAQSIALNGFSHLKLLPLAVADSLGHARVARRGDRSPELNGRVHPADLETHDLVPTLPLGLLSPALRKLDVMRLDVGELMNAAIRGAHDLVRTWRPTIFAACGSRLKGRLTSATGLLALASAQHYAIEILRCDGEFKRVAGDPATALDRAWCEQDGQSRLHLRLTPLERLEVA